MTDFLTEPAFEIGRRLEIRGSSAWFVVLRPVEGEDALANFVADLSAVLDQPVRVVRSSGSSFEKLRSDLHESPVDPVLITDLDQADAEHWRALDVNRSAWLREGAVVLWLSAAGVTDLCSYAPNIRSIVGGSIFNLGTDGGAMTVAERDLQRQDADLGHRNNVLRILKKVESHDLTFITLGPSFDQGLTDSHFYLESGSRLSFGITLREGNRRCSLIAYRFQLNLPESQSPSFYRFDLNEKAHEKPLDEPRCHYHPGVEDVRLPCPALTPLDVLDRIFLVIEPRLLA